MASQNIIQGELTTRSALGPAADVSLHLIARRLDRAGEWTRHIPDNAGRWHLKLRRAVIAFPPLFR